MKADLHLHTCCSDGALPAKEVMILADLAGMNVISFTDHDTISAYDDADIFSDKIKVITGVELSCHYQGDIIHILGYNFCLENKEIRSFFKHLKIERMNETITLLRKIRQLDVSEEVYRKFFNHNIRRENVFKVLQEYGCSDKVFGFIDKAITDIINSRRYQQAEDGIRLIRNAGGIAVLAHPNRVFPKKNDLQDTIRDLQLDGLECYHPSHDANYERICKEVAEENRIGIFGGSDYHSGVYVPPRFYTDESIFGYEKEVLK